LPLQFVDVAIHFVHHRRFSGDPLSVSKVIVFHFGYGFKVQKFSSPQCFYLSNSPTMIVSVSIRSIASNPAE
jgi:hypothetical protein